MDVSLAPRSYYKPIATRTWTLSILLLFTLLVLALTEYARRVIPARSGYGSLSAAFDATQEILPDQFSTLSSSSGVLTTSSSGLTSTATPSQSQSPVNVGQPFGGYLSIASTPAKITTSPPTTSPTIIDITTRPADGFQALAVEAPSTSSQRADITGAPVGGYLNLSPTPTLITTSPVVTLPDASSRPANGNQALAAESSSSISQSPVIVGQPFGGYLSIASTPVRITTSPLVTSTTPPNQALAIETTSPGILQPVTSSKLDDPKTASSDNLLQVTTPISPTDSYTSPSTEPSVSVGRPFEGYLSAGTTTSSQSRSQTSAPTLALTPVSGYLALNTDTSSTPISPITNGAGVTSIVASTIGTFIPITITEPSTTRVSSTFSVITSSLPLVGYLVPTTIVESSTTRVSSVFSVITSSPDTARTTGTFIPTTIIESSTTRVTSIFSIITASPTTTRPSTITTNGSTFTIIPTSGVQSDNAPGASVSGSYLESGCTGNNCDQITLKQYIIVAFVPLILALIFSFPWRILDTTIREMEPFYQLHRVGGASAEMSLLLDYPSTWILSTPFKALRRRHFEVFLSSSISVLVLLLIPLSSEVLFVYTWGECGANPREGAVCHAVWANYAGLATAVEAILGIIAFCLIALIFILRRRSSGVYANPLSIAGIATLSQSPHVLQEFSAMDSRLTNAALAQELRGRSYRIGLTTGAYGSSIYGLVQVGTDQSITTTDTSYRHKKQASVEVTEVSALQGDGNSRPERFRIKKLTWRSTIWNKIVLVLAFICIGGMFIIVTYYHWTSGDTGFERYMNSQTFGVRFLFTAVGILIKLFWSKIDENLRRIAPYQRLSEGNASASDSVLVYTYMSPISSLMPSFKRRHYLVPAVSLITIFADVLPIVLANVPFSPALLKDAYEVCTYIAMGILFLMLVLICILLSDSKHYVRNLPRKPGTLASTLLYIATLPRDGEVGLVKSLEGLDMVDGGRRDAAVEDLDRLYSLGWTREGNLKIDDALLVESERAA